MSTLRAYLGTAGLLDVGLRFYTQNTPEGARITTSIVDEGDGWYSRGGLTLVGDHVRWDSTGTPDAAAREDLALRIGMETLLTYDPNVIADAFLARNIAGGSSVGRIVSEALAFLRNKWAIVGSTLTVYDADDTTILWTADITSSSSTQQITGSDPT
jgi:hypothetical protein